MKTLCCWVSARNSWKLNHAAFEGGTRWVTAAAGQGGPTWVVKSGWGPVCLLTLICSPVSDVEIGRGWALCFLSWEGRPQGESQGSPSRGKFLDRWLLVAPKTATSRGPRVAQVQAACSPHSDSTLCLCVTFVYFRRPNAMVTMQSVPGVCSSFTQRHLYPLCSFR